MAHTARLRNRIEAYLTGLAGAADTAGDSRVLGAGTTGSLVAIATGSPGGGRVGDGEHRQRPARPAGREGRVGCQEYFGVACVSDPGPRPAIDDFTSKQAAIVGLAKLTDASEVRRVLQVAAEADNPTHLDLTLDQQRAKRSLRLSARANGMWAITGMLDEVDGAILAETLASFTRPRTPTTPPPGPTPRRCPDRHVQGRGGQHPPPAGCPRCPSWWIWENLPTSDNATLVDGTPWALVRSTCCRARRCAR